jgi:hypothetical protein
MIAGIWSSFVNLTIRNRSRMVILVCNYKCCWMPRYYYLWGILKYVLNSNFTYKLLIMKALFLICFIIWISYFIINNLYNNENENNNSPSMWQCSFNPRLEVYARLRCTQKRKRWIYLRSHGGNKKTLTDWFRVLCGALLGCKIFRNWLRMLLQDRK